MKDFLGKALLRMRVKALLPHIRGHLLDIGCGTNKLVEQYSAEGIGIDVYPWPGVNVVVEDTAKLPFDDFSFDTITIVAALNHIPNREDVLREAWRVLSPRGRLMITMIPPVISRVWHFIRSPWDADQKERGMVGGEVFGFTSQQIIDQLDKTGFKLDFKHRFMLGINCLYVASKRKV